MTIHAINAIKEYLEAPQKELSTPEAMKRYAGSLGNEVKKLIRISHNGYNIDRDNQVWIFAENIQEHVCCKINKKRNKEDEISIFIMDKKHN